MAFATQRISGSLTRAGTVDLPSDPGWSQPDRHRADSAGGGVVRDDASAGGGWAPQSWGAYPGEAALPGGSWGGAPSHRRFASHDGDQGRGDALPDNELESTDVDVNGDAPAPAYGGGGAAHGGLVLTGISDSWANAAYSRRRADGGVVVREGGLDLGRRHIHPTVDHRQGLHMNRPTIRYVRTTRPVVERNSPYPGSAQGGPRTSPFNPIDRLRTFGVVTPRARRILRPFGQTDMVNVDQYPSQVDAYDPGVIGSEWVQ